MFFLVLHTSVPVARLIMQKSRFGEIILALMGLKDTWLINV